MNILKFMLACMTVLLSAGSISAVTPARIDTVKARLVIPRKALEAVPTPLVKSPTDPIDTLDTANEYIKVILYADNTWQYYKTPEYQQVSGVFENHWTLGVTNPYGIQQSELPTSWSIWLVDGLDQYHCPFIGDVHPRGKFGPRRGRRHQGVDLPLKTGELRQRLFLLKKKFFNIYSNYEQDFEDEIKNEEEDKAEDAEKAAMKYYTVRSGDTLSKIARNHGTTIKELCRLNGINQNTTLKIGRKLRVR